MSQPKLNQLPQLTQLQELRDSRIIVYHGEINADNLISLYECLRNQERAQRLDLLLSTGGGEINAARRFALLLREYCDELNILIPFQARSSGTLLSLAANELVMGPLAILSPIDPQIWSGQMSPQGTMSNPVQTPLAISAEDIKAFRKMAEDWFTLTEETHRLRLFELLSQRIFPTSLSNFYRTDQEIRQIATELLAYQIPKENAAKAQEMIEQLVSGYHSHLYCITRTEAKQLGLPVSYATSSEEQLMWHIFQACQQYIMRHQHGNSNITMLFTPNFMSQSIGHAI